MNATVCTVERNRFVTVWTTSPMWYSSMWNRSTRNCFVSVYSGKRTSPDHYRTVGSKVGTLVGIDELCSTFNLLCYACIAGIIFLLYQQLCSKHVTCLHTVCAVNNCNLGATLVFRNFDYPDILIYLTFHMNVCRNTCMYMYVNK